MEYEENDEINEQTENAAEQPEPAENAAEQPGQDEIEAAEEQLQSSSVAETLEAEAEAAEAEPNTDPKAAALKREYDITHNNYSEKRTQTPKERKKDKRAPGALFLALFMVFSVAAGALSGYFAASGLLKGESGNSSDVVMYTSVVRYADKDNEANSPLNGKQVVALTENSVVEIRTEVISTGTLMSQYVTEGAGSGVIITEDGYIATNNHVIADASNINVTLKNGEVYQAQLIATDEEADVAVLKIEAEQLQPVIFGDSDSLTVGEDVIAIGNPLGELGGSVTMGIVSALDREITVEGQMMTLMQFDAAINPGNSGGGLFNMYGELIGLVNAKSYGEEIDGIGFAIPANTAKKVIADLVEYGYVRNRVRLGITMVDVTSDRYAAYYGVDDLGVYVYSVEDSSLAQKEGIKRGDRILSINDTEITSAAEASAMIKAMNVGEKIELVVERNNKEISFDITATEYIPQN